jgi:hypothetical protein
VCAALPGQSLVVYDPDSGLITDLVPCEDAHMQERSLMEPLLQVAQPGELWLADRNFCTRAILGAWHERGSCFVVREHGCNARPQALGELRRVGRVGTGMVSEQRVSMPDAQGQPWELRRIELELDEPTEDGDTQVRLPSNAPASLGACEIAALYRRRWRVECLFQRLEAVLQSEIASLGQPRAALLAFGVAAMAYNVLAALQAALGSQHAPQISAEDISPYFLAVEIRAHYAGMLIAVAPQSWQPLEQLEPGQLGRQLLDMAARVDPRRFTRHPRGPKPPAKKSYVPSSQARRHVSTARVMAKQRID